MKRTLILLLCLMLFFVGCAAVNEENGPATESNSESSLAESPEPFESSTADESKPTDEAPVELQFESHNARTGGEFKDDIVLIDSFDALKAYYKSFAEKNRGEVEIEEYTAWTERGIDPSGKYNEEFFEDKYLVFVIQAEGSGSISHSVKGVKYENGAIDIKIYRYEPNMQTCDEAIWHIIVELDKAHSVDSAEKISTTVLRGSETDFASVQTDFAEKLFREAVKQDEGESVLVSPLSVQLALAMTANGAKGETLSEMQALLCGDYFLYDMNGYFSEYLDGVSKDEKLKIANSIWMRDNAGLTVKDSFLELNRNYYQAELFRKAFDQSTADEINAWVDENTKGMIKEIVDEIDPSVVMYLINALCFEDEWASPYNEYDIRKGEFTAISGEKREVEMMHSDEGKYIETDKAKGFVKDYKNREYSFVALLPDEDTDINDYIASLDVAEALGNVKNESCTVTMPKFSLGYSASLKETLANLGMPAAFDGGRADFSQMASSAEGNLYIGDVQHKTFIQVDGLGTKAGAVTSVEMLPECAPVINHEVTLNRPFVYMIVDNETNIPIFIGVLNDIK